MRKKWVTTSYTAQAIIDIYKINDVIIRFAKKRLNQWKLLFWFLMVHKKQVTQFKNVYIDNFKYWIFIINLKC